MRPPHYDIAANYAKRTAEDEGLCDLTRLTCKRFLDDLKSGSWDFDPALPEFCIEIMEGLFCFKQGERLDGSPLMGHHLELMDWQIFCTYNICGFFLKGTKIRRFTEADIFAPRKTVKTTFAEALMVSLALYYRMSGSKTKSVAGSLKQSMEGFDFLTYNFERLGLIAKDNPDSVPLNLINSSLGHKISGPIWGGTIDIETLAFKPDLFDSFNAAFVHLDELELYKNAIPYARLRDASKAFSNKLILCTFTAGDDGQGFAASHRDYGEKILRGQITGPDADRCFWFMAEAPKQEDGSVDYTNPAVHRAANPSYGITIRPDDMVAAALQAQHNPELRKEFLTRSLNSFVNAYKAWFKIQEFQSSDWHYNWSLPELAKLVKAWYGGADLSKLHDLTAACIVGEIPAKLAACPNWTPPEDVLVIIPHCWFPIVAAAEKADEDQIPLFGWKDDGWLDMPDTPSMDPTTAVKQFKLWKNMGFKIKQVGHDRKFAKTYCIAMEKAGFKIKDQPQLYMIKSEGLRYIEHKAKVGCLYYCHAEPYEYCVSNVHGVEKSDDAVQYEKINEHRRIDVFDSSVFAVVCMLNAMQKLVHSDLWKPEALKKGE